MLIRYFVKFMYLVKCDKDMIKVECMRLCVFGDDIMSSTQFVWVINVLSKACCCASRNEIFDFAPNLMLFCRYIRQVK